MATTRGQVVRWAVGPRPIGGPVLLLAISLALSLGVTALTAGAASAAGTVAQVDEDSAKGLVWGESTLDGREVERLTGGEPVPLSGDRNAAVHLAVTNLGNETVHASDIRVTGRVMGLAVYRYATRIDAEVRPGGELELTVPLDLDDLTDQAVGLIPSNLAITDPDGDVLLEQRFTAHVKGSLWSEYGVFGLAIAASTAVLLVALLVALWRGLLPENRWRRALQFLPVGTGLGLTLTFTLSAIGLLSPGATWWVTVALGFSAALFAVGYLLPMPYAAQQSPVHLPVPR